MKEIPLVMTASGPQPTPPATLNAALIASVAALVPDYTATLPGSLIEDISSTDTAALYQIDQARIDLINSITPYGANLFILSQQAILAGVPVQGSPTHTSVYVTFIGTPGYILHPGFTVSDGQHRYLLQEGVIIGADGISAQAYCLADISGSWPVPAGTVTTINTSVPSTIALNVTNRLAGLPGGASESDAEFRARSLQAYMATGQGMISYLKTNLLAINDVQPRLVSVRQVPTGYTIICGGGDPYLIAEAIFRSLFWLPGIVGSTTPIRNIKVDIYDYPDLYPIVFVNPPQQSVHVIIQWSAVSLIIADPDAVVRAAAPAVVGYINNIGVGLPINMLELDTVFQAAVANLIPITLLSNLIYTFTIDGNVRYPVTNTRLIASDPESYFYVLASDVQIVVTIP